MPDYIVPFDPDRLRNTFDCGRVPINRWYKNKAKKCVDRLEFSVFEYLLPDSSRPVGYYALQVGNDKIDPIYGMPENFTKNLNAFPTVHLAFLGVDLEHQRQGIGTELLTDIFEKSSQISHLAGVYALTLQSLDEESTKFYKRIGFKPYGGSDKSPKLLMPIRTVRELVEGN